VSAGQLRKHDQIASRYLRNSRGVVVYLPPGYDQEPGRHFPVLYLHDGQNLFDGRTSYVPGMDWHVGDSADASITSGRADRYGKFLLNELMPFIQTTYRVERGPNRTGIGGSSLGGLVSLYLGLRMPGVFGKIAALSPSVWWNHGVIVRFAQTSVPEPRPHIWLDIGTREGPRIVDDVEMLRDALVHKGWRLGENLHYQRVEGAEHNEAAWAQRVRPFLEFLFPAG